MDALLADVVRLLERGKPARRRLPGGGFLALDRPLPFLLLHRRSGAAEDRATAQLIRSEASFLILSEDPEAKAGESRLIRGLVDFLVQEFRAFLVIEVWSAEVVSTDAIDFSIAMTDPKPPSAVTEALLRSLSNLRLFERPSRVRCESLSELASAGHAPILSRQERMDRSCVWLGLEVESVYRDKDGREFPIAVRGMRRKLSRCLRRAAHQFALATTTHPPPSYLSLGRSGFLDNVLDIDKRISAISQSFDFLMDVTPVDVETRWLEYEASGFQVAPRFTYRPLVDDPIVLKRKLLALETERIEDPALEQLYRDKQIELDRQLTMLLDRGSRRFRHGSEQLYGVIDQGLIRVAKSILGDPKPQRGSESRETVSAEEFAAKARAEIDYYRGNGLRINSRVEIRDDLYSGLLVSGADLLIGRSSSFPASRVVPLIQHEVGTHILTYLNGRAQPLELLACGLVGYDELQEGLAVLSEFLVGGLSHARLRLLAARVLAAAAVSDGANFVDTHRLLVDDCQLDNRVAFTVAMRVHRGGGLTKDAVYLRGLVHVLEHLAKGRDLHPLYIGKIGNRHIPIVRELTLRGVLKPPPLKPRVFSLPEVETRLELCRKGLSVNELCRV